MKEELEIAISVQKLLEKLKANRERFIKSYDALLQVYEKKVTQYQKEYATYTKKVITKSKTLPTDEENMPIAPSKPENRTKDYDFYIGMLETNQTPDIILSESLYRRLWTDLWDWTRNHWRYLNAYGLNEIASCYSMIVE